MRKTLLTKSMAIALFGLSSMAVLPQAQAAITMDSAEKAALVEQRLSNINQQTNTILQRATNHPIIEGLKFERGDIEFASGSDTAKAVSHVTVSFNRSLVDSEPLVLTINDTIDFSEAVNKDDVLARVSAKVVFPEDDKFFAELSEKEKALILDYLNDIKIQTDLLEDSKFTQQISFPSIDAKVDQDEGQIIFDGLTVNSTYNEETMAKGVELQTHFDMKRLALIEQEEEIDYDALMAMTLEEQEKAEAEDNYPMVTEMVKVLDVEPFTIDIDVADDGELKMDSSKIVLHIDNDSGKFSIDKISGKGNVAIDEKLGGYLGKQHYTLHNVVFDGEEFPTALIFDQADYIQDVEKSEDLYNVDVDFSLHLNADSFKELSGGALAVNSLEFGFNAHNFSEELALYMNNYSAMNDLNDLGFDSADVDEEEAKALLKMIASNLAENNSSFGLNFALDTDKGVATLDVDMKLREGSDPKAWVKAIDEIDSDSSAIEQLAQQDVFFTANVSVPVALLDTFGVTSLVEMQAGPYVEKDGDNMILKIENQGKGIMLNGKALEAPVM